MQKLMKSRWKSIPDIMAGETYFIHKSITIITARERYFIHRTIYLQGIRNMNDDCDEK